VMAARLGANVSFVGKVGGDIFGQDMRANFTSEGIDTTYLQSTDEAASGVAVITVDEGGRNTIVVIPGANGQLRAADVALAQPAIQGAAVLVCQYEVPVEATLAAMRLARQAGIPVIFNPAPVSGAVPDELIQLSDIICPNETEAHLLTGQTVESLPEAETAARILMARGAKQVIITLGERGCLLVDERQVFHAPAPAVKAIDTTGAGDAFVGSLAFFLAAGAPLNEIIARANQIAAISVQAAGTQTSYPRAAALPNGLVRSR
ncbi:MAG TPA: PfkB family carbohydrate kinase, partial [Caldilineaceae bacterium]|nr:PfkB family carbohydrate kinase [Caldilineaceae bacterium]